MDHNLKSGIVGGIGFLGSIGIGQINEILQTVVLGFTVFFFARKLWLRQPPKAPPGDE